MGDLRNGCGCDNGCGNNGIFGGGNCCSWIWIILLLSCFCGNGNGIFGGNGCGNSCGNGCGCGGDSCWWIILLLLFCGGGCGNGCGNNNCGCGC